MALYAVRVPFTGWVDLLIEAEDAESAIDESLDAAWELAPLALDSSADLALIEDWAYDYGEAETNPFVLDELDEVLSED